MQVILVNPGGGALGSKFNKYTEKQQYMYPYSIIYLQNYLLKDGIQSDVFDLFHRDITELLQYCAGLKSPIVGVTAQTRNRDDAIDVIRKVKQFNPTVTVVVGGRHFSYCAQDTLEHVNDIDIVVRGEGEITFLELVKALREDKGLESVEGITYRRAGHVIHNYDREQERDIDKFSLDYDRLPNQELFAKGIFMRNYESEKIKSLPVLLARGCSQRCVFCAYRKMKYRVRSLEDAMREITYLRKKVNFRTFGELKSPSNKGLYAIWN